MVVDDIPTLVVHESVRRLAKRIGEEEDVGNMQINIYTNGLSDTGLSREIVLHLAALTLTTEIAQWN